jgi:hypothetical protein
MTEYYKNYSLLSFEGEEWRDVKDFIGYQVSNFGRVKSIRRKLNHSGNYSGFMTIPEKIKSQVFDVNRYLVVGLNIKDKTYLKKVHRLVCMAFIKNSENKILRSCNDKKYGCKDFIWRYAS